MATLWYWLEEQVENGPIPFSALVNKVRDRALNEDDLVRPAYSHTWQAAGSVIGLFQMARREEHFRTAFGSISQPLPPDALENTTIAKGNGSSDVQRAIGPEMSSAPVPSSATQTPSSVEALALIANLKSKAIADAVTEMTRKHRKAGKSLIWAQMGIRLSQACSTHVRHLALSIAIALVTASTIAAWSNTHSMRHPSQLMAARRLTTFPFWGECTVLQHTLLTANVTMVAGCTVYCALTYCTLMSPQ